MPRVVVLSSSSLNNHLSQDLPIFVHGMLLRAAGYVYEDLRKAEAYYRLHGSWMTAIFVQPGGLVDDVQRGHVVSLDREHTPLSYLDLAAGMVEIADKSEDAGTYDWKGVTVVPATDGTRFPYMAPVYLLKGLAFYTVPPLYWVCKWLGIAA